MPREDPVVTVNIEGRPVAIQAWRYDMEGVTGHMIPIYMLDTDLEQNDPRDRKLTDHLYGGDSDYRLRQEMVLGIGGAPCSGSALLPAAVYHMNEGHAALLTIALMELELGGGSLRNRGPGFGRDAPALRLYHPYSGARWP